MESTIDQIYIYTDTAICWKSHNRASVTYRQKGPASIRTDGQVLFYTNLRFFPSRPVGPTNICADGTILYNTHSECQLHRTDGPAIIYPDGRKAYYSYDKKLSPEEFFLKYGVV